MWIHHSIRKKKVSVSFCFQYHFFSNLSQDKNICNQWRKCKTRKWILSFAEAFPRKINCFRSFIRHQPFFLLIWGSFSFNFADSVLLIEFLLIIFFSHLDYNQKRSTVELQRGAQYSPGQRSKDPTRGPNFLPKEHFLVTKLVARNDRSVMVFTAMKEQFPKSTMYWKPNMDKFCLRETRRTELYKSQISSVHLCLSNGGITELMVWNFFHFR